MDSYQVQQPFFCLWLEVRDKLWTITSTEHSLLILCAFKQNPDLLTILVSKIILKN